MRWHRYIYKRAYAIHVTNTIHTACLEVKHVFINLDISLFYSIFNIVHILVKKVKIVECQEPQRSDFVRTDEVVQITSRVCVAYKALAVFI